MLFNQLKEVLGRITFDVELRLRKLIVDERADLGQVGIACMPLVRARMYSQAMRPGGQRNTTKADNTRPR